MVALSTDYFQEVGNPGSATTLSAPGHAIAGASITVGSTSNHPTATGYTFAIDTVTLVNGVEVRDVGSYTEWEGVVTSGTTIGSMVLRYGTDQNYPAGSTTRVYIPVASSKENRLAQGLQVEHTQGGVHALTANSTLTSSKHITAINDTNGNELFKLTATTSAVNEFTVANAATGTNPKLTATGGDSNISLEFTPKGTGRVILAGAGAGTSATVATSQTTTSTSYADLATVGSVTATIGTSGQALVTLGSLASHGTADLPTFMSFAVSGASTVAAGTWGELVQRLTTATAQTSSSWTVLVTGLTVGSNVFTTKFKVSAGTGTFANRWISVLPL